MIVWLASFPRSGNTWFRILLHRLYGVRSYSLYDESCREGHTLGAGFPPDMASMQLDGIPQGLGRDGATHFVKTHGPPTDAAPAVCIVRDGRDALVSYARFQGFLEPPMKQRPFEQVLRELITTEDAFHNWSKHTNAWVRRAAVAATVWASYEVLVKNPVLTVAHCLRQLHIDLEPVGGSVPEFAELQRRWPTLFRKGKTGAWRDEMPEELHRLFWQHHGALMERFGYLDGRPAGLDRMRAASGGR
jgi:hypothetical protein